MQDTFDDLRKLTKKQLRILMKKKLHALEKDVWTKKENLLAHFLVKYLEDLVSEIALPKNFIIGAFFPLSDEPQWFQEELFKAYNRRIAFPRLKKIEEKLVMEYALCPYQELVPTSDPLLGQEMRVPPLSCDSVLPHILLVPALAYTYEGFRLGRGGGFFDRYLDLHKVHSVGVIFEEQLLEDILKDSWDRPVDAIITDAFILKLMNYS